MPHTKCFSPSSSSSPAAAGGGGGGGGSDSEEEAAAPATTRCATRSASTCPAAVTRAAAAGGGGAVKVKRSGGAMSPSARGGAKATSSLCPSDTVALALSFSPLIQRPLVEQSSMETPSGPQRIRACTELTKGYRSTSEHESTRPTVCSGRTRRRSCSFDRPNVTRRPKKADASCACP
eukprot:scaffold67467_cov63-Phaeocystis_antarctica.AAC.5